MDGKMERFECISLMLYCEGLFRIYSVFEDFYQSETLHHSSAEPVSLCHGCRCRADVGLTVTTVCLQFDLNDELCCLPSSSTVSDAVCGPVCV